MNQVSQAIAVSAVLAACTGTEVGNPVTVDMELYNESFDPAGSLWRGVGPFTIDVAWVAVDRIRLRSAADCDGSAEREFEGPFFVDLRAPGAPESLEDLDLPDIDYCRFELKWNAFDIELPAGVPPALRKASVLIAGSRADGTPFVLRSSRDDELRLDAVDESFPITDATAALFVGFDAQRLFAGVDLDSAAVSGDGTIYIDGENNDGLLDGFDDNLRDAAELFDDDDGDGELDDDERDADDALAR